MAGYTPGLLSGSQRGCFRFSGGKGAAGQYFPLSAAATGAYKRNLFGCRDCGLLPDWSSFRGRFRLREKLEILSGKFELCLLLPVMGGVRTKRHPPGYEHESALEHKWREFLRPLPVPDKDGQPQRRLILSGDIRDNQAKLAKGLVCYRLVNISDPPLYGHYKYM